MQALPHQAFYILDKKRKVVFEPDLVTWAEWMTAHQDDIIVKQEHVGDGHTMISTVFTGLDIIYNLNRAFVFETMVFFEKDGPPREVRKYKTWEAAEAGHEEMKKLYLLVNP